ncbi:MAG: sulfatase [Verrucomicrobiota bacterium]
MKAPLFFLLLLFLSTGLQADDRPNIFFFFADDWGKYASIYQDPEVPSFNDALNTPAIDRIGKEGVVFENAFVNVASCGPCRASLATGRYFWNCGSGAFLKGKEGDWPEQENPFRTLPKFVDLLRTSGYFAQKSQKTFSFKPSKPTPAWTEFGKPPYERYGLYVGAAGDEAERRKRHDEIVQNSRLEMQRVLKGTPEGTPFFFVFGSINVHRPYLPDSGMDLWGIDPDSLEGLIPPFLPDEHDIRRDFSDYLGEVQGLDLMLGAMIDELEKAGELDNTVVILSGDHGIPGVPRGKTNCYDLATRVPMIVRWPAEIPAGRRVEDFVSVTDVGPTLLELAGVETSLPLDGKSFLPQLTSSESGWIDGERDFVVIGRERHVPTARTDFLPYPMRAIRSKDFLYIRNFKPDRWPQGIPGQFSKVTDSETLYEMGTETRTGYSDLDGGLTKAYLLSHQNSSGVSDSIAMTLKPRPEEELYSLSDDPHHLTNLVGDEDHRDALEFFRDQVDTLMNDTNDTNDPRLTDAFDAAPWVTPEDANL